jgi:hypothetical protein
MDSATSGPQSGPSGVGGRLSSVLGAIARIALPAVSAGLEGGSAGIGGEKGTRASFGKGLGGGAAAEDDQQATQSAIKFQTFQDQVRAANLHNQDLQKQQATDDQQKAQQAAEDFQKEAFEGHGGTTVTHPNNGAAVLQTGQAATAANGSWSIPPGTNVSADGDNITHPGSDPASLGAQVKNYQALQGVLPGLPPLPAFDPSSVKTTQDVANARTQLGQHLDIMNHVLQGYNIDGSSYTHDQLNNMIPSLQSQIDSATKNGNATPYQLDSLKNTLAILKANESAHSDAEDAATAKATQQAAAKAGAVAGAQANAKLPAQQALEAQKTADKPQKPVDNTELNTVAYDPNYQNPDGSKGGNVVMNKEDAASKGLTHYKADASGINSLVAGFNDVQNKINGLASIANDPSRMSQVDPGLAARMLAHGKGVTFGASGLGSSISIDTSRINEEAYAHEVQIANQATKDYVTAFGGAHEAITQLPRLQTFGKSSRMTQQQMEAAQNLLPQPGDGTMAGQKMVALQQMLDPLRKQIPNMPGAVQIPSWMQGGQKQAPQAPQQAPQQVGSFNPQTQSIDYTNLP